MTEYFVSFDLAKKLKEKGFREKCLAFYTSTKSFYYNNTNVCSDVEDLLECCNESEEYDDIDAPTISQVLKWLRQEKKIHICIDIYDDGWFFDTASFYKEDTEVYEIEWSYMSSNVTPHYDSYEQAAIAGIEYILDNLI